MKPISIEHYRRRRALVGAAERVGVLPAEHPAATLQRDAAELRDADRVRYPALWDCRRCGKPNKIDETTCATCGAVRSARGDR